MVADRSGKSSGNSSDNRPSGSRSVLSAFGIRSFRYQWSADAMSTWGSEMETLILGWYILVATDSPFLVGLLAALRFSGTITAPVIGVIADRMNRKVMLISLRIGTVLTAMVLLILAVSGLIQPWHVFIVAGFSGLLRPADNVLRQSLIADTVPRSLLMNASGFARTTQDSARIVGALLGATLLSRLGLGWALTAVSLFYGFSVFFGLGIRSVRSSAHIKKHMNPLADMKQGAKYIMDSSALQPIMFLAFLVNATAFPFTNGLLPVVARDVYGHDENGLAVMIATFAGGALVGSLLMAAVVKFSHPERFMMLAMIIWHLLLILFAQTQSNTWGLPLLALIGASVSFCMITMSVVLLTFTKFEMRGRVMGVRMLAVYALPMGMVLGGWLIEQYGVSVTITGYAVAGLVAIALSLFKWPRLITGLSIVERG